MMKHDFRHAYLIVLASLLLLLLPIGAAPPKEAISNSLTPADTGGPIFVDLANWAWDTILITEPVELHPTLQLFVWISDEVAVDLAIGCFKKSNETQWSNVTMTLLGYSQLDPHIHRFGANATEFTLSPSHPLEAWNIKYYAHDSLGRWNVSDVTNGSTNALYDLDTISTTTVPPDPIVLTVTAIMIVLIIAAIIIARRKG